jgi:hypothetical protein
MVYAQIVGAGHWEDRAMRARRYGIAILVAVALGQATVWCRSEGPATSPARANEAYAAVRKGDPEQVVDMLNDGDAAVRKAACDAMLEPLIGAADKPWVTGAVLVSWIQAMERCPAADLARNQNGYWAVLAEGAPRALDRDCVAQLRALGDSQNAAERRAAVIALGGLGVQDDAVVALLKQRIKDTDAAVRLATIYAVLASVDNARAAVPEDFRSIPSLALNDADAFIRERATAAAFMMGRWADLIPLPASATPEQRAVAALCAYDLEEAQCRKLTMRTPGATTQPGSPAMAAYSKLVQKQTTLLPALRHPWFWVRAFATDRLFRIYSGLTATIDANAELLAVVGDANAEAARDAALRLNGDIWPGLPMGWKWVQLNRLDPQIPQPHILGGGLATDAELCRDAQASRRVEGVAGLESRRLGARPAIALLTELFADPEPSVRQASRRAAQTILKAVIQAKAVRPRFIGTQPATGPAGTRPVSVGGVSHTQPR